MVVFYAVAGRVFLDPHRKWFAFFFAAAGNTLGLLTNGSLAVASSLVFLTLLPGINARRPPQDLLSKPTLLIAGSIIFSILLAFFLNNYALTSGAAGRDVADPEYLQPVGRQGTKSGAANLFQPGLASGAGVGRPRILSVRSSGGGGVAVLHHRMEIAHPRPVRANKNALYVSLVLPLICAAIVACVVASRLGYLPAISANQLFST